MRLVRLGTAGAERPGIQTEAGVFDVSAFGEDYSGQFFATDGVTRLRQWWARHEKECPAVPEGTRFGAPVAAPSKLICIGLNYADHARETNATPPEEPIIFFKATSSLTGPNDEVIIPRNSGKTDWEVELAVVIGKKASYVEEGDAMNYVAGYCLHNDYSERSFQLERGGQWVKGKSCDTFAPLGPALVTPDEIADINKLRLWLTVNGKKMQDGNTADLIFKIPFLVSYLSQFMSLLPGDIISTGTPAGVGLGMQPQVYLKAGDVVECGIDGLGSSRQELKAWSA
ncbi:fumarylacetoacetate hydrolase family protein [Compostibacter hankyongensis]|uniref:Fumarylacetoacetate hydrolase family protein n=1 Tax=Compostibacter hankyongensis TaxID=1007089 RepID=A0ABP8G3E1_9BACT